MRNLVPIKVKIGLTPDGHANYPNFNQLKTIQNVGMDWSKYVDMYGLGWHYDKKCGHKEEDATSPFGMQWGVLVVAKEFADEAITKFPDEVTKLTEAELEDFYDTRSHIHEPDEDIDDKILAGIKLKQDLKQPLTVEQKKALDPNNQEARGIRKNLNKKWKDYKIKAGVNIIQ